MGRYWALSAAALVLAVTASTTLALGGGRVSGPVPHAKADATAPPASPDSSVRISLPRDQVRQAIAVGELDREVKSILNVHHRMHYGEFLWDEGGVPEGPSWIRVDLDRQLISIFRSGHEIGTAVILYGANDKATPAGHFRVLWKHKDHHSATYDAAMPYTLRLTDDGVAIHGSEVLSGRATHGCIGVPTEFARHLFENVSAGDDVIIVA